MVSWVKKNVVKIILAVLYILLFFPVFYSIYYAVPASDDFAMALGRDAYGNVFKEFFAAIPFYWTKRGGTMFSFITELLVNPLNIHRHLGHYYGWYMIVAFVVCMAAILYGVKTTATFMLRGSASKSDSNINNKAEIIASVVTFITAVMLLENDYYVETYNWYVGMMAYAVPMAALFLAFGFIIKFANTGAKKYYIGMIIAGVFAANTTALDIPLGIFFLYIVLIKKGFKEHCKSTFKRYLPLICYILTGLITVIAPGNFARQGQYTEKVSVSTSVVQTIADVKHFGMLIITQKPVTIIVLAVLFFIGVAAYSKADKKPGNLFLFVIASVATWVGCILPYVYGRGMTRTYLDVRMQYVLDYFIQIALCLIALMLGQWVAYLIKKDLKKVGYVLAVAVAVLGVVALFVTGRYTTTVSYEVKAKAPEIVNSFYLWDSILCEIENGDDQVVVDRDYNVPWNKYFLYSGMEPGEEYAVELDSFYDAKQILPNVYYGKKSIVVNYPR